MSDAIQRLGQQAGAMGWQAIQPSRTTDPLDLLAGSGTTVQLPRDGELYAQGDRADYCYRIVSGCLRTVKLMEDGRRQVGAFLLAGDYLGFDELDTHDFAAQAVTKVVVQRYRRREVEALADRHPSLARRLRELAAADLRAAYDRMLLLGRKTASERIATFLLELAGRQGGASRVTLPMGRIDMADHLGLTVETVCRMLTHLRHEGVVTITLGSVELRSPAALRHMAADLRH